MIIKSLNDYLIDYHVFSEVGKIDECKVRQRAAYITTQGLFPIKLAARSPAILLRDSSTDAFSRFCEIFKNIYFAKKLANNCFYNLMRILKTSQNS